MQKVLESKVAIVTGMARGLGESIALGLARAGAKVVGCDLRDAEGTAVAQRATKCGDTVLYRHCDITNGEAVAALVDETVGQFGRLDILVNNAGILPDPIVPITEMEEDNWKKVLDVNIGGAFRFARCAIPHMLKQGGGSIINLSSVQASHSQPGLTAYATTKGALISMARQLAVEYGPKNIRCNSISPGAIDATMTRKLMNEDGTGGLEQSYCHMHALERLGRPEEVAATAVFLASDGAAFITGEDILVDGGLTKVLRL
jgi:short-subunit dehydrogenase